MKKVVFSLIAIMLLVLAGCKFITISNANNASVNSTNDASDIDKGLDEIDKAMAEMPETSVTPVKAAETGLPQKTVSEGDLVSFPNLKAVDPEGKEITYSFTEPLNSSGKWQTKKGDAGKYAVTVTASDGVNKVSQDVIIIVTAVNTPPVISIESPIKVSAGDIVHISPKLYDADGDKVTVKYSGWMNADSKATTKDDVGTHNVTLTASDGKLEVSKAISVIVQHSNTAPKLDAMDAVFAVEGEKVVLTPTAKDIDNDKLSYSFSKPFDENGVWQTMKGDAGNHTVKITVSDGTLTDSANILVVVRPANKPPVLKLASKSITVDEGKEVDIKYDVSDPDGDAVNVSFSGWMNKASYTTNYDDQGTHTVTVTATDGINTVSDTVTVIVNDVNRPPAFAPGSFV